MSINRRLLTDADFEEAMQHQKGIRVFQENQIVDSGGVIIRFDDSYVVVQSGVSDIAYYSRTACEFFELRKR